MAKNNGDKTTEKEQIQANYEEGSELMDSLKLAAQSICKQTALRHLSEGE